MSADMSDDENITSQEFDEENFLECDMFGEENGLDSDMSVEYEQNSGENHMSYQASLTSLTSSSSSSSSEDSDSDQDYVMIIRYFRSSMEYVDKHYFKQQQRTSILSGHAYIEKILNGNDSTCFEMFRVHIPVFCHLCYTLRLHRLIVEDEGDVSLKELVAMFLYIVGHNARQRVVRDCFQHSLEMIHCRFRIVLHSIHALEAILIKPDENYNDFLAELHTNNKYFPWFEVINEFLLVFNL
jgi:hypothetical protein